MTLSSKHQELVGLISDWCEKRESSERFLVFVDTVSESQSELPPLVEGYRPDVAWLGVNGFYEFIGEAKTAIDLRSKHTREQLDAFLRNLETQGSGLLIVSVPWGHEAYARSMLAYLQTELDAPEKRWVVISDGPRPRDVGSNGKT